MRSHAKPKQPKVRPVMRWKRMKYEDHVLDHGYYYVWALKTRSRLVEISESEKQVESRCKCCGAISYKSQKVYTPYLYDSDERLVKSGESFRLLREAEVEGERMIRAHLALKPKKAREEFGR